MDRKPIKAGQLLAILNQRMMRHKETATCRIIAIAPVATKDPAVCNWSSAVTWNAAGGGSKELAAPFVKKLVMNAQKEFNLLPAGANALN